VPKAIHDRAMHLLPSMKETYPPKKAKSVAFAVATQQAHAKGQAPKGFGTPQGKREAKAKFDKPKSEYKSLKTGSLNYDLWRASQDALTRGTLGAMQKEAANLTAAGREKIKPKNFALPKQEKYPIHDAPHARNALARVSQHGTPAERATVRSKVYARFPGLKEHHVERTGQNPTAPRNLRKQKLGEFSPRAVKEAQARSVVEEILGIPREKRGQLEGLMGAMNAPQAPTGMDPGLAAAIQGMGGGYASGSPMDMPSRFDQGGFGGPVARGEAPAAGLTDETQSLEAVRRAAGLQAMMGPETANAAAQGGPSQAALQEMTALFGPQAAAQALQQGGQQLGTPALQQMLALNAEGAPNYESMVMGPAAAPVPAPAAAGPAAAPQVAAAPPPAAPAPTEVAKAAVPGGGGMKVQASFQKQARMTMKKQALSSSDIGSFFSDPRVIGGLGGAVAGGAGTALATRGMKDKKRRGLAIAGGAAAGGGLGLGAGEIYRRMRGGGPASISRGGDSGVLGHELSHSRMGGGHPSPISRGMDPYAPGMRRMAAFDPQMAEKRAMLTKVAVGSPSGGVASAAGGGATSVPMTMGGGSSAGVTGQPTTFASPSTGDATRGSIGPSPTTRTAGLEDFESILGNLQERSFQEAKYKYAQYGTPAPNSLREIRDREIGILPGAAALGVGAHVGRKAQRGLEARELERLQNLWAEREALPTGAMRDARGMPAKIVDQQARDAARAAIDAEIKKTPGYIARRPRLVGKSVGEPLMKALPRAGLIGGGALAGLWGAKALFGKKSPESYYKQGSFADFTREKQAREAGWVERHPMATGFLGGWAGGPIGGGAAGSVLRHSLEEGMTEKEKEKIRKHLSFAGRHPVFTGAASGLAGGLGGMLGTSAVSQSYQRARGKAKHGAFLKRAQEQMGFAERHPMLTAGGGALAGAAALPLLQKLYGATPMPEMSALGGVAGGVTGYALAQRARNRRRRQLEQQAMQEMAMQQGGGSPFGG